MELLAQVPPPLHGAFVPFPDQALRQSIPERFENQVREHGERLAIRWPGGSYTYASLNATANRLARALQACRGPDPEPVALLFDHGGHALAALLGVLKAGKFYVVLDPTYPTERLGAMLRNSGARLLIAGHGQHDLARRLGGDTVTVLAFDAVDPALPDDNLGTYPGPEDLALLLYTSGSTGEPKAAMHTHRNVLADARNLTNSWWVSHRDRWLLYTSLSFANSVRTIYAGLLNGASLYPYDMKRGSFGGLTRWLQDNAITIIRGVPTFFGSFASSLERDTRFASVRILSLGGEGMLGADLAHFNRFFAAPCVLVHAFGPTECLTVCFALIPHGTPPVAGKLPIGRPLRDKDILVLDESHREVPVGEVGEIAVRSRYIATGYWRDPARTQAAFLVDPAEPDMRIYLTGDLGKRLPDGGFIHVGRRDFQVKIRGFRVEVTEIESALREIAGLRDAVVVGREMAPGDMRLVAYYVATVEGAITPRELRTRLATRLPEHMIPSHFVAIAAIPHTPNGKTDRLRLPAPPVETSEPGRPARPPRDDLDAALLALWQDALGVTDCGIDHDFFDLGGDSLKAARIAAGASTRFGIDVPASAALRLPTVAAMAQALTAALAAGSEGRDTQSAWQAASPGPRHSH